MGGNQGAFFEITDDQKSLRLLSSYAYEKRKYNDSELIIDLNCGLLGQSVLERDIIYMTDVPKSYVKITSGLGEATPRSISIVPLFYRDQPFGVIELASFNTLEEHQKSFLKQASEIIASELANTQVQIQTKHLLEKAQEQANQLSSQEEELRQSMEEMTSTHEEMRRSAIALEEKLEEIELERAKNQAILESCSDGVISFNELGHIEFSNAAAQDIFGLVKEEMFNKTINGLLGILIKYNGQEHPKLITKAGNEVSSRTEVNSHDRFGNEISLLLTAARVKVKGKTLFTLFAQKISVDLF
jgi:PAS domain S-box-containing protein